MTTLEPETGGPGKTGYNWYVVVVLLVIYSLNQLDRTVINILGQSIKTELHISDTQLGLLTGTSFAVFYSLMGLPMARLADRVHRVNLISIAVLMWSALTVACGFAVNYATLFAVRMGVGVGEAGGTPPSQSVIADYFPHQKRSTAIALFNSGVALGTFLGFLMGGYVNQWWGWRVAFMVAGAPGIVMAVILKLTVKEPVRGRVDGLQDAARTMPPLGRTIRRMLARRSYLLIVLAASCSVGITFVAGAWLPPLFIRLHGFNSGQIGGWLALFTGVGGGLGSFFGGFTADRLKKRTQLAEIYVPVAGALLAFPSLLVACLARDTTVALAGVAALYACAFWWIGPTSSMIHRVVPVRSRALGIGFMLFFSNITALAFGPPLIGAFSDAMAARYGADALRYALASASVFSLVSAALYVWAARYYRADVVTNTDPGAH
ncbi:MAG TPA: MFS transporter [Caulobacteraceae bacterium]|nr:MFS transporter [Caulobacteraceae bacterium]